MDHSAFQKSLIRLAMIGDGGVGKTALVIQLCLNKFVETYDPTIEDSYRKRITLNDQATTLEVMDTAGQEEFDMLRDQWIRDGEGFMLVYSITRKMSFTKVQQYYNEIIHVKAGEPFAAVLVGNKIDQDDEREVSTNEGENLAKKWNIPFFETSAKLNVNTELAFSTLARLTMSMEEEAEIERSKNSSSSHSMNDSIDSVSNEDNHTNNKLDIPNENVQHTKTKTNNSRHSRSPSQIQADRSLTPPNNTKDQTVKSSASVMNSNESHTVSRQKSSLSRKSSKKHKKKCILM